MVNFRPLSLFNILYKLIANRFQKVMDGCIDKAQSVFVPRRLISDKDLLVYELLHTFRQKRSGHKRLMALKLEMRKAYDRVEWVFF